MHASRQLLTRKTQIGIRRFCALMTALSLVFTPAAQALQIRTGQGLRFFALADDHEEVSLLRAGSVVDVPDQYRVLGQDGRPDGELTLNNWLKNAGRSSYGDAKREGGVFVKGAEHGQIDYFYPVKVIAAAPGSRIASHRGNTYFLALRILNRAENSGTRMTTVADTRARPATPDPRARLQAASACTDGRCYNRAHTPSAPFENLMSELRPALNRVSSRSTATKNRTADDFEKIRAEFRRTCGFSLESFRPIIRSRATAAGVPEVVLLSIMVQESSGHCFDVGQNSHSSDHGLFGLNSRSTRIRACTASEKHWLRNAGVQNLARGPHCIENPLINLDAAIEKLHEKISTLAQPYSSRSTRTGGFDERRLKDANGRYTAGAWRMAVSAYNGGERWVMTAKADLENFNAKQNARLDPYNWEDLRVFYLRRFLNQNREASYFGRLREGRTSTAILNLSYAENVVPRRGSNRGETKTIAELWHAELSHR